MDSSRDGMVDMVAEAQKRWRGIVLRRVRGDRSVADDLLQRFALRALERLGDVQEPVRVHGWLRRVLASTLADHAREVARRAECAIDQVCPGNLPVQEASASVQDAPCSCLLPVLRELRTDQAQLLHRVDLTGERRELVAAELGIQVGTLHVRLHRARRALAAQLRTSCHSCPVDGFLSCAC